MNYIQIKQMGLGYVFLSEFKGAYIYSVGVFSTATLGYFIT